MKQKHLVLIVEDDNALAEDLAEIVKSLGCDSTITSNRRDAQTLLQTNAFCLVLLDLQIKGEPDSIRGHTEHGNSLLREIRQKHSDHTGRCYWLPVLIVSGFAREVGAAVDAMKDGASDIIHKPFISRDVSGTIRHALALSGRSTHNLCSKNPAPWIPYPDNSVAIAIPGDRERRRTRVIVGGRSIWLTDSSLKLLLRLAVAHEDGRGVHKRDLGANDDQGFKGVSVLREALKPTLGDGVDIIGNDHHGFYDLTKIVTITHCDAEKLATIGDTTISDLARKLRKQLETRSPEAEGNS